MRLKAWRDQVVGWLVILLILALVGAAWGLLWGVAVRIRHLVAP